MICWAASAEAPACDIPVRGVETTFFWPLTLDLPPARDPAAARLTEPLAAFDIGEEVKTTVASLEKPGCPWRRIRDPLAHLGGKDDPCANNGRDPVARAEDKNWRAYSAARREAYAEYVYVHDFVQHFLYRQQDGNDLRTEPFYLFQRQDIACVEAEVAHSDKAQLITSEVTRLSLYVFRTGVAILVLGLEVTKLAERDSAESPWKEGGGLNLADVQAFNDQMRRVYVPFFVPDAGGCSVPPEGFVPNRLRLYDRAHRLLLMSEAAHEAGKIDELWQAKPGERFVRPMPHWEFLLSVPKPLRLGATGGTGFAWRHVVDERLPILASISVTAEGDDPTANYRRIRRGDWARLCFVDGPGKASYPCDPSMFAGFEKENCYDRFHDQPPDPDKVYAESRTRYLMSGYALVAVGAGWFFDNIARRHLRRHYFQMALLAQFEFASLLAISSRISRAVADYEHEAHRRRRKGDAETRLEVRLQTIERDFLQFIHRFRFHHVSNQIQAIEMFELMRARMRLPAIFDDVKEEITTATDFLATRAASRQADAAARISVVATLGVVAGVAASVLGMNVLVTAKALESAFGIREENDLAGQLMVVFTGFLVVAALGLLVLYLAPAGRAARDPVRRLLIWILSMVVVVCAGGGWGAGLCHNGRWPALCEWFTWLKGLLV